MDRNDGPACTTILNDGEGLGEGDLNLGGQTFF